MTITKFKMSEFKPLRNKVFVHDLEHGLRLSRAGLILPDDNMSERGVHPRWGQVYCVGEDVKNLVPGDWVFIKHGRWTQGIDLDINGEVIRVWGIEYPDGVEMVSDTDPRNETKHSF